MSEKAKMLRGELYLAMDPELVAQREVAEKLLAKLNRSSDNRRRDVLLRSLLGSIGTRVTIRSPFYCDYGYNVHLGSGVFLNFNCVLLDVMPIYRS
jgi:maltose O-acetyltransferase